MKVGTEHIVPFLSGHRCDLTVVACTKYFQTSYLSQILQIIYVEKNLSCGEISEFCKELEQFMEFYRNLCRFCSKFVWRKNDKYEVWSGASQVGGPCFSELTGGTNLDEITQFCLMATHTHHQVPSNCVMIAMVEAMYNLTTG